MYNMPDVLKCMRMFLYSKLSNTMNVRNENLKKKTQVLGKSHTTKRLVCQPKRD